MEVANGAACFFLTNFVYCGRKETHHSSSGYPCYGQEKQKIQLRQYSALLEMLPSKQIDDIVVKEEGIIQIFGVNDKVYFDAINGEEFLALTTRKAEPGVLNSAQTSQSEVSRAMPV